MATCGTCDGKGFIDCGDGENRRDMPCPVCNHIPSAWAITHLENAISAIDTGVPSEARGSIILAIALLKGNPDALRAIGRIN